jgi:O-succinylbenzoate synthase
VDNPEPLFSFKAYRRPFRTPVRTSRGLWRAREGIIVRLERDDGALSFGEIAPIDWFGTESFVAALSWCSGISKRATPEQLSQIPASYCCCRSAVAAALRGLASDEVVTGADDGRSLEVAFLLPESPDALDALERAVDRGFRVFKMKIGIAAIEAEQDLVRGLVERLPDGGKLRLDANGGLDLRAASEWVSAAEDWPVEFIEQPLSADAAEELSALARDTPVTLALDESVLSADDVKRWRDRGWAGVFVIKPALAGSLADLSTEIAIDPGAFVISSALETNAGATSALGLAFDTGIKRALGFGVGSFFPDDGLGGGIGRPRFDRTELITINPEDVWNLL